jgi:glycosyltransferase involved in cell wall biosynthesis
LGLPAIGFEPLVVLPDHGPLGRDLQQRGVEVIVRTGLSVLRRGLLRPAGLARLVAAAAADARVLATLIDRRRVALVHSNTSVVLGGAAAARLAGVPHVWHVREIYARFGAAWPAYRRLLLSAAALPCVSRATAAQFTRGGDRPRPQGGGMRPVVIHDGLAVICEPAPRAAARAALGLEAGVPAIGMLGRISDWKGQDVLVRALAEPKLAERGALGVLAGDAWPGAEQRLERVLALARSLGVRERLRLLGFRDDVENVYGACDLIAVPSIAPDPLPGAAVESAAAGCAVIASACGGLPEIIRDGETGRLIAPGDERALASVAAELLDDPGQRARLGAAARADVRERFAPERLLERIQALYEEILGCEG